MIEDELLSYMSHEKTIFFIIAIGSFFISFLGYFLLNQLRFVKNSIVGRYLYIPARKSSTNAIQLGGLPFACTISLSLLACTYISEINHLFSFKQIIILKRSIPVSWLIILYGYLDDKFELRPIIKLIFQVMTVLLFSIGISSTLYYRNASLSFVVLMFWGMGVLNGANLLDGLDTMTIKLSIVTLLGYSVISYFSSAYEIIILSSLILVPLLSFSLFNKAPAKIHLGEIGGSYFGFMMMILSALLFVHPKSITMLDNASLSLMLLSLPMIELGVTFLRRLYNNKSPFIGDRYHIHHILTNYYELSSSSSTTLMAIVYSIILIPILITTQVIHSFFSFSFLIATLVSAYLMVGIRYWVTSSAISLSPRAIFESMRKKDVMLIDSSKIDDFRLIILDDEIERDIEELFDEVEKDKAA